MVYNLRKDWLVYLIPSLSLHSKGFNRLRGEQDLIMEKRFQSMFTNLENSCLHLWVAGYNEPIGQKSHTVFLVWINDISFRQYWTRANDPLTHVR